MSDGNELKIKTAGDLRTFLVNTMLGVKDGTLDLDKASRVTKVAAQINESLYAELKAAKLAVEAGGKAPVVGALQISNYADDVA